MTTCESCKQADWTDNTLFNRDNKYLLCKSCVAHLKARALTPREWYNLIIKHGKYAEYINDKYYYTNGVSILPKFPREIHEDNQLPNLNNVKNDFSELAGYCLFPYSRENLSEKISMLQELAVKESKVDELISNEKLLSFVLEADPKFIEKFFTQTERLEWIKSHWENNHNLSQIALIKVSLLYLSIDEVLALVTDKIIHHRWDPNLIGNFPSAIAIDWVEKNAGLSAGRHWDFLANLNIPWATIENWLSKGRPLSMLGLKTLTAISQHPYMKLQEPASIQDMVNALEAYKNSDSTPNIRLTVNHYIATNLASILKLNAPKNFSRIENENYSDPFMGKLKSISNIQSQHIRKFKKSTTNEKFTTQFGGQPDWLSEPEWPLSQSNNLPMKFIAQIRIDKKLFPDSKAEMAYIFMSDDDSSDTWEYFGGDNAVILQPGNNDFVRCENLATGKSITRASYIIDAELTDEPNYIPKDALSILLSRKEEKAYFKKINVNKIGGIPCFLQSEEYPGGQHKWFLLLQLATPPAKFAINFGDNGSGYVFLSEDGTRAVLGWQCY